MSKIVPIEVKRISNNGCGIGLSIKWSNGEIRELPTKLLREKCPCATCQELSGTSNHSKPLSPKSSLLRVVKSTIEESIDLKEIWSVGNYAIGLKWADNHDSGIYNFNLLYELGNENRNES